MRGILHFILRKTLWEWSLDNQVVESLDAINPLGKPRIKSLISILLPHKHKDTTCFLMKQNRMLSFFLT